MNELIRNKIEVLLSKEFYCSPKELNGESTIYSINSDAKQPYIKILAYRNCVVVCTSADLHSKVREILQDKTRDEIFELPLVYGQKYIMSPMITAWKTFYYPQTLNMRFFSMGI